MVEAAERVLEAGRESMHGAKAGMSRGRNSRQNRKRAGCRRNAGEVSNGHG
jgi:hypothetical protein